MADDITLGTILEHIQAMKNDLQTQISRIAMELDDLRHEVKKGFEEARQHREALQEDLEATMRLTYKHEKKLARMK